MSAFYIKLIAAAAMLVDHVQVAMPAVLPIQMRVAGRLAFPLFAFLLAEGLMRTKRVEAFLLRLGLFALISEPFFDAVFNNAQGWRGVDFLNDTNVFYTLFLGGCAVYLYKYAKEHSQVLAWGAVFCIAVLAAWLGVDFSWTGVVFIFACHQAGENKSRRIIVMAIMCLMLWRSLLWEVITPLHIQMTLATLAAVPLAALYNGRRGHDGRWWFYIFYPLHLMVLGFVV
jgi:hypothetical protein